MAVGVAVCVRVGRAITLTVAALGVSSCTGTFATPTLGIAVGVAACRSLTRITAAVGVCAGVLVALAVAVAVWVGIVAALSLAAGACPHARTASRQSAVDASQVSMAKR